MLILKYEINTESSKRFYNLYLIAVPSLSNFC